MGFLDRLAQSESGIPARKSGQPLLCCPHDLFDTPSREDTRRRATREVSFLPRRIHFSRPPFRRSSPPRVNCWSKIAARTRFPILFSWSGVESKGGLGAPGRRRGLWGSGDPGLPPPTTGWAGVGEECPGSPAA